MNQSELSKEQIELMKNMTVGISINGRVGGSGFVVGRGIVATAYHNIKDFLNNIGIRFYNGENMSAKVIYSNSKEDLILLKADIQNEEYVETCSLDIVQETTKIYACGCYPVVLSSQPYVAWNILPGYLTSILSKDMFMYDSLATFGCSGGPIFYITDSGQISVVGIIIGMVNDEGEEKILKIASELKSDGTLTSFILEQCVEAKAGGRVRIARSAVYIKEALLNATLLEELEEGL